VRTPRRRRIENLSTGRTGFTQGSPQCHGYPIPVPSISPASPNAFVKKRQVSVKVGRQTLAPKAHAKAVVALTNSRI